MNYEEANMALELQDVGGVKVHPEVHALLKARAAAEKTEMVTFIRELLHAWARKEFDTFTLANDLAKAKGLSGIVGDWR